MKKLFLAAALLGGSSPAWAQHSPAIGLTVAYARTSLASNNGSFSAVNHAVYQGGLQADFYFSDMVSFHPEALYSWRAYDAKNEDLSRDVSYLDVPLLARIHADGLFFEAGAQVSVPLTVKNEAGADVKSQVNSVALDYVVGLGYQLHGGPSLGIRYDGGATNVYKKDPNTTLGTGHYKAHTFLLVLGYEFGGR